MQWNLERPGHSDHINQGGAHAAACHFSNEPVPGTPHDVGVPLGVNEGVACAGLRPSDNPPSGGTLSQLAKSCLRLAA